MVHYSSEMLSQMSRWEEGQSIDSPLHANGVSYQAYYSEVGKAHYMGKDLTEVRSSQRKLIPDIVGLDKYEPTSLRGIAIKAREEREHHFQDLYRWLNSSFLLNCWKGLKKNAASGVDGVTAELYEDNVYLHFALDLWFEKVVKAHCKGDAMIIRYADDYVCAFKWLNRRGGKRKSFSWKLFMKAIERLCVAKPKLPLAAKRHRVFT